jgi:5-methylcytosine-specific restriction endonuclease McrA
MEQRVRCRAAEHARNCDGYANTVDHFTPKSLARLLHWNKDQLNQPDNLIPMHRLCHNIKDRFTAQVKLQVKAQLLRNRYISLGGHI